MVYNKDFLLELDKDKNKTIYARITALRFDESPIELIEGRVTGGSINIDGTSAIRRSCSLTMVASDYDYRNYYWGLNTKFKLEVGLENHINSNYPKVCWFEQGIYLITQFNTSRNATSFNISISGKDKMCQLNGEIGGNFESSVDFGQIEEQNADGTWSIRKIPVQEIIREMIHQYAGEPFHNIIINGLENHGLELLDYQYDNPMYLYRLKDSFIYDNILFDGTKKCTVDGEQKTLADLGPTELEILVESFVGTSNPKIVEIEGQECYIAKVEYGQTAGYRLTDLVYPGELVAAAGDTVTSVLDKIVNMLGEFEYFYDLKGQFIFQPKQSFINVLWTPVISNKEEEEYVENLAMTSSHSYMFSEGELITSFNNNPNLTNLKNDYSIWGTRTSIQGTEVPIHLRYAIDDKPIFYKNKEGKAYVTDMSIFEELKAEAKKQVIDSIHERIQNYRLRYDVPEELPKPRRQADGSWGPGWWDIRDWHDYYYLLTLTVPSYTMKWYSKGGYEGCVPATSLDIEYSWGNPEDWYTWLLVRDSKTGKYSYGHGTSGAPEGNGSSCTLRESYYDKEGKMVTTYVLDEFGNRITKNFTPPYLGCTDTHTYLAFLEDDVKKRGDTVYFYNPAFPAYDNIEDLLEDQIEKEYEDYLNSDMINLVDWREIIYQMALDYYKYGREETFEIDLAERNNPFYENGMTGYENYYTDLQGFWRQLYYPIYLATIDYHKKKTSEETNKAFLESFVIDTPESEITNQYNSFVSIDANFQDYFNEGIFNEEKREEFFYYLENKLYEINQIITKYETQIEEIEKDQEYYYQKDEENQYWRKDVYESPQSLNFWFDFLDTDGELAQYRIQNVGRRPKVVNDSNVKSIYFRDTPDVIFREVGVDETILGYKYIQVPNVESMFRISTQGKSAKDKLDELIYNHAYCVENATIVSIPIYYLEPNTRVYLCDTDTGLSGDYIVSKFTIPLSYNGTMSITATKAAENIV